MIQKLRFVLIVLVIAIVCAAVWSGLRSRVEKQRKAVETREALRKTTEFLKPNTTSDIRFGKKASGPTPAPTGP